MLREDNISAMNAECRISLKKFTGYPHHALSFVNNRASKIKRGRKNETRASNGRK